MDYGKLPTTSIHGAAHHPKVQTNVSQAASMLVVNDGSSFICWCFVKNGVLK